MIEHVSLRCRDSKKSRKFYQSALRPLGYKCDMKYGDSFGFQQAGRHDFWITRGKVGTPTHIAFHAASTKEVDAFWNAAMKAGGKDNGKPGPREKYGYAAFVYDPDGHNIEVVIWDEELRKSRRRARGKS
ncbi:MAG TPA: VOC family protein [Myxococcales bacterium]|nr:VOC family protein [Myxococcales bacterium]